MGVPVIKASLLAEVQQNKPLLLVGPSLGTSTVAVWGQAAALLAEDFNVAGWDLPGHGASPVPPEPFTMAELAEGVAAVLAALLSDGVVPAGQPVYFAGDSLGGAVGIQLGVDYPDTFAGFGIFCSGAKIGEAQAWLERAETVRVQGTPTMVTGSAQRWFAPGFIEREPEVSARLLHSLQDADRFGYARCCEALAGFDLRDRLGEIATPLLAVAGEHDVVTPIDSARLVADGVRHGTAVEIPDTAHMVPAEAPKQTADLLSRFFLGGAL